jgi:hypothetical protein
MGLLDQFFGTPEQTQALGLLGRGMMGGNTAQGFGDAFGLLADAPRRRMQQQLLEAQIAETLAQAEERKLKGAQAANQQAIINRYFGNGAPSQPALPGQLGSGSYGAVSAPAGQPEIPPVRPGGRLGSMSADDLALLKLNGLDISEAWKAANIPTQIRGGAYSVLPGQAPKFMPDPSKGYTVGPDGSSQLLPNFTNTQTALTMATEGPKALLASASKVNLRPNADGTSRPVSELDENPTLQNLLRGYMPQGAPTAAAPARPLITEPPRPRISPETQRASDQDSIRILQEEVNREQNPQTRAGLQRELDRMTAAQNRPGFPTPSIGYGKTSKQDAAAAAEKKYAEAVGGDMAETRKNIMSAGFAAPSNIAKYQQLGKLLEDVDGGTLTAAGTQIASTMNSLGIKIDKNLPNKEAAASLGNQIALELRNPAGGAGMPGALSDSDRKFLVSMTPNAGQTAQGRKMIVESYVALQKRNQQVATFARNYEKKYGQLDNGFFEQMQAWSNANPMFRGR